MQHLVSLVLRETGVGLYSQGVRLHQELIREHLVAELDASPALRDRGLSRSVELGENRRAVHVAQCREIHGRLAVLVGCVMGSPKEREPLGSAAVNRERAQLSIAVVPLEARQCVNLIIYSFVRLKPLRSVGEEGGARW